jgi:hypothetical protein
VLFLSYLQQTTKFDFFLLYHNMGDMYPVMFTTKIPQHLMAMYRTVCIVGLGTPDEHRAHQYSLEKGRFERQHYFCRHCAYPAIEEDKKEDSSDEDVQSLVEAMETVDIENKCIECFRECGDNSRHCWLCYHQLR